MKFLSLFGADTDIKISASDIGISNTALDENALAQILNTVYIWAGIVAVLVIIIGGIRYTTSNGDPASVKSAKNTILYAVVGLIVIMMAAAITQFTIKGATGAGSGGGDSSQQSGAQESNGAQSASENNGAVDATENSNVNTETTTTQ